MSWFVEVFAISSLNGTNGFKISGEKAGDFSGSSVASAGDVNGDGIDDLIIGASGARGNGYSSGTSYVVFGKIGGFAADLNLSALNGTNGFQINGETANDSFGRSVASAGDVNGDGFDGFDDLVIGASSADPHGSKSGASYVVFGKATGFSANFDPSTLDGTNGFQINGEAAKDYSGISVASAGDVNGDGIEDLIIGAPGAGPSNAGAVYIVFGKSGLFSAELNLSSLDGTSGFQISGDPYQDRFGLKVAPTDDVNGDGIDDLVASGSNSSYVIFGTNGGSNAELNVSSLNGNNGFQISFIDTDDNRTYLTGTSAAGDVNGDGFGDLIFGTRTTSGNYGGDDDYASYVVFGKVGGFTANVDLAALDESDGFKIVNGSSFDRFGGSVASAGDLNGDGIDDLVIGAQDASPHGRYSGSAYVVFGKASGFGSSVDVSSLRGSSGFKINGVAGEDRFGSSISAAGDLNGDGIDDLVFGAIAADPHGTSSGASYVIFGKAISTLAEEDNLLEGSDTSDTQMGYGGNDTLLANGGADSLDGGNGNDTLDGGAGADTMNGGDGNDLFFLDNVSDTIRDSGGIDKLTSDTISLSLYYLTQIENASLFGYDDLNIYGNKKANILKGNDGSNYFNAYEGSDRIYGAGGNDTINGGAGIDTLFGGNGDDVYVLANLQDKIIDSAGSDWIGTLVISINLTNPKFAQIENAFLEGSKSLALIGNAKANELDGNTGSNKLVGADGNDTIYGNKGNDLLIGGAGIDVLIGNGGRDVLAGGSGRDYFIFGTGDGRDRVTDFDVSGTASQHDYVDLRYLTSITNYADLTAHHMRQVGNNVVINGGSGDVLTLVGVDISDLTRECFFF